MHAALLKNEVVGSVRAEHFIDGDKHGQWNIATCQWNVAGCQWNATFWILP